MSRDNRHPISELIFFVLCGSAHLIAAGLIFLEREIAANLPESTSYQLSAGNLWWLPLLGGICWIAVPIIVRVDDTPMTRLLSLALSVAAVVSGFGMLALAFAAAGA